MRRLLKELLWAGAVIAVPGLGIVLLAKKLFKEIDDHEQFRKHVKKTYGYDSRHEHDTRNV